MSNKKDTYYFSHDANARTDPKITRLLLDLKAEGYGVFWVIVEMLRNEPENRMNLSDCNAVAYQSHCDPKIVKRVIEDFGLFEIDENKNFWSESLNRRVEEFRIKSDKARTSANFRWKPNANAMRTQCDGNAIKESKGKESKDTQPQVLGFLEYFNQKTGKNLSLTDARKKIINDALKFNSINKLKQAVDNFSKDEWPDRRKYMDIIYCIGTIRGINNLDKWATEQPKNAWVKP